MVKQIAPKFERKALEHQLLLLDTQVRPSSRIPRLEKHKRKCQKRRWGKVKYRETEKCRPQQKCYNVDKHRIEQCFVVSFEF